MTKREGAILTAYTGMLLGDFNSFHEYVEEIYGHPVWTHQFGDSEFMVKLKELSKQDFLNIVENQT